MLAPTSRIAEILAWLQAIALPATHLSSDSRNIAPGDIFFAYPSEAADGRHYIANAIERGAQAVVYDDVDGFQWDAALDEVPHRAVTGLRKVAGPIANAYYGAPDAGMLSIAVTGTNGKTSCSQWLGRTLSKLVEPTAVIGTLGVGLFERGQHGVFDVTGYTTPDAVLLQRKLAELRDAGAKALAIEASSIGLEQDRLTGMHVDIALFTNFTRDHLDYHGDMAVYEAAKTQLFNWPGLKHAVINLDDDMGLRLIQGLQRTESRAAIIGYTIAGKNVEGVPSVRASDIRTSHIGTTFHLECAYGSAQVKTQLVGNFNVSNVLCVMCVLLINGVPWRAAIEAVEALTSLPGRMQQCGGLEAPLVVIDYAHTPDALEKTLIALRHVAQQRGGQLWCVFGCGGDRDPGKRAQMGIAASAADQVIVTSDNPRSENASDIIAQIIEGMNSIYIQAQPQVIEDRAAAILRAVKCAAKKDVVLLAGKGHEAYQEVKGKKLPFLDADHAALALAARATMKGGN